MAKIVIDLDATLTMPVGGDYIDHPPYLGHRGVEEVSCRGLKFRFILHGICENMKTPWAKSLRTRCCIVNWLNKHDVPFDEIHIGKPWCGDDGFYVDDKAIRPDELRQGGEWVN